MIRRARVIAGVLILVVSCALLIWGFMPLERVRRVQTIDPASLQIPTSTPLQTQPTPAS
jgi:hypothetical protein